MDRKLASKNLRLALIIVTLGLTGMLIGILEFPLFGVFSGIVMLVAIISWIRSAVREYRELPLTHD